MLRIAICDDIPDQLTAIAAFINEYIAANELDDAEVRTFSHPDALLTASESERFQLYILDIVMPMVSGLQLGREIRRMDREAQIIYVTTAPEFALESFSANPINYLLKPLKKQELFDTLSLAITKLDIHEEASLIVKTRDGLRILAHPSIVCCEYVRHAVVYTLSTGETVESLTIRSGFAEYVAPLLADKRFLKPHSSYVLNMSRVVRLTLREFVMQGGTVVPIAGKQYTAARNTYLDYMLIRGNPRCK